jgi:hypothetical protein
MMILPHVLYDEEMIGLDPETKHRQLQSEPLIVTLFMKCAC